MGEIPKKLLELENLLQQGRHGELGQLLVELTPGKSTVDLISSKILNQIAENYNDEKYEDIQAFLEDSGDEFSWGDVFEDGLNMNEIDDYAAELKVAAFNNADELTHALFKYFYADEYVCLNKLKHENLLDSWSCIAAAPYDGEAHRGLRTLIQMGDDPSSVLNAEEKLLFADGAEFNFLNWSLLDSGAESFSCPSCNGDSEFEGSQRRYQNCTKDGCPNGELNFMSGSDMDLQCYTTEDQSIILVVGGWGKRDDYELDFLTNRCVPYVAGTLGPSDILTITTCSWNQFWRYESEENIKSLIEDDCVLELALDKSEEYLVIGWKELNDYDGTLTSDNLSDFTEAIFSLKNWMNLKAEFPIPSVTIYGTRYVTIIRQQAKSRFRDYVDSILRGQVFFGRGQVVEDSKDSEYLARIAEEEDDEWVLERVARNKFTPRDTLKQLSEHESTSVRWALLDNSNLNAKIKSQINSEKELTEAIWNLFTESGIRGLTYLELQKALRETLYGSSVKQVQQTSKSFLSKFKKQNTQGLDESDELKVRNIVYELAKSSSLFTTKVQRSNQAGDENTVLCLQSNLDRFYHEQYRSEPEEIWNERLRQIWRTGSL